MKKEVKIKVNLSLKNKKAKAGLCFLQIFILVLATVAFAVILGGSLGGGQEESIQLLTTKLNRLKEIANQLSGGEKAKVQAEINDIEIKINNYKASHGGTVGSPTPTAAPVPPSIRAIVTPIITTETISSLNKIYVAGNTRYFITSGELKAGSQIEAIDTVVGQKVKIDLPSNFQPGQLLSATHYEMNLVKETVTLPQGTYTLSHALQTPNLKAELIKNPELLKGTSYSGIKEGANGQTILTQGDKTITIGAEGKIVTPAPQYEGVSTPFGKWFGSWGAPGTIGGFASHIIAGAMWAISVYGMVKLAGSILGIEKEKVNAAATAAAAGIMATHIARGAGVKAGLLADFKGSAGSWLLGEKGVLGLGAGGIGIAVGIVVFIMLYKKESKKIIYFECKPWEAPIGGNECQKCNDEIHECTDYRCKSLGQACGIINKGTNQQKCVWLAPGDVKSPGIKPWLEILTPGYKYTDVQIRPPGGSSVPGKMRIVDEVTGGCVKPFTPLTFGIQTFGREGAENEPEPAQCKISYKITKKYDEMQYYFGNSILYEYNHSQSMSLPSPAQMASAIQEIETAAAGSNGTTAEDQEFNLIIKNDGLYTLYVRCRDANGNVNEDEFAIRFCVEKGPDTTPPKIEGTSIANNMPVSYSINETDLEVYVNEPSECKWSREDKDYNQMETALSCSGKIWEMNSQQVYVCKTRLTGIKDMQSNKFYFRCKDQPGGVENDRNINKQSYVLNLIGTQPLTIKNVKPNETIKGSTRVVSVNLSVETAHGYKEGQSTCYYSSTGNENDYIAFYETNSYKHKQRLDLISGTHNYFVKCVDLGGNSAYNKTSFKVDVDILAPLVVRAYQSDNKLKIITDEKSDCSYSTQNCNFVFEEGINMPNSMTLEHYAEWNIKLTYYVKCRDEYNNPPAPDQCSIIMKVVNK